MIYSISPKEVSMDFEVYLDDDNSPLLNRAINAYNVGSVFKPCVAAAGIEKGKGAFVGPELLGKKLGDVVTVEAPGGEFKLKILEISK